MGGRSLSIVEVSEAALKWEGRQSVGQFGG